MAKSSKIFIQLKCYILYNKKLLSPLPSEASQKLRGRGSNVFIFLEAESLKEIDNDIPRDLKR